MFGRRKDSKPDKDQAATLPIAPTLPKAATFPDAVKIAEHDIEQLTAVQPERTSTPPEAASSIGSGLTVVGKLVCDGSVMIYGHVEGELQASNVVICEGAQVEGNIVATELGIGGRVKGTIHAVRVPAFAGVLFSGRAGCFALPPGPSGLRGATKWVRPRHQLSPA
jgi:hypothetical protein